MIEINAYFIFLAIAFLILVFALIFLAYRIGHKTGWKRNEKEWETKVPELRKAAIKQSRAVIGGQFSENLAPYLPDFPFLPTECSFLGKPVDFIVFKGSDEKNIEEVVFVEVKSGKAKLNAQERKLRDAIQAGSVSWFEYRIPEDLTL